LEEKSEELEEAIEDSDEAQDKIDYQ